jgi:glycolate oxidase
MAEIMRAHGAIEVRGARDEAERAKVWTARKRAFGALGRIAKSYSTQDGVIPRSKIPEALRRIAEIGERHRLRIANIFHAGDGNLHPCILLEDGGPEERARVLAAGEEILRACLDLGGALTGEHGIGLDKRERMGLMFSAEDLAAMKRLREAFDPTGLCNPGKIFPAGGGCVEAAPARNA